MNEDSQSSMNDATPLVISQWRWWVFLMDVVDVKKALPHQLSVCTTNEQRIVSADIHVDHYLSSCSQI